MQVIPERVIVADDHPLFRNAIQQALLQMHEGIEFINASDFKGLEQQIEANKNVDLVLLDLHMPGMQGFSGLVYLCKRVPHLPVIMVSANEDPHIIRRSIEHGAAGFIPKSSSVKTILTAVSTVLQGDVWLPPELANNDITGCSTSEKELAERMQQLTRQQYRVLGMISQGMLNKQIAHELGVSEATIKVHVTAIMRKLGVTNRTQAVLAVNQLSVAPPQKML